MGFDLAEQFIQEAEDALGATLPDAYRAAMMTNNGGTVDAANEEWELILIKDSSDRKRLARSCNDIVSESKSFRKWIGFPVDAVAIAENGSGDCILFLRDGDRFHTAPYVWNHETGTIAKISDDFSALDRHQ